MGEVKADRCLKVLALLTEGQRISWSDGDSLILQKIVHNLHNLHSSFIFIAQCAVWVFIVWAKTCIEERCCHIVKVDSSRLVNQQPVAGGAQPPSVKPQLLEFVSNLFCRELQRITAARLDTIDFVGNLSNKDLESSLVAESESGFHGECFETIGTVSKLLLRTLRKQGDKFRLEVGRIDDAGAEGIRNSAGVRGQARRVKIRVIHPYQIFEPIIYEPILETLRGRVR